MGWLERLQSGVVETIERHLIKVPLSREPGEVKRRTQRYGDFSRINNRWYASASSKTHLRLEANSEEWAHYHTMYSELREAWDVVPFKEEIRWLQQREGLHVADFGCGEALIAAAVLLLIGVLVAGATDEPIDGGEPYVEKPPSPEPEPALVGAPAESTAEDATAEAPAPETPTTESPAVTDEPTPESPTTEPPVPEPPTADTAPTEPPTDTPTEDGGWSGPPPEH